MRAEVRPWTRALLLLTVLLLAGCSGASHPASVAAGPRATTQTHAGPPPPPPPIDRRHLTLSELPDAQKMHAFIDSFTQTYPNRFDQSPTYGPAREYLRGQLKGMGYDVKDLPAEGGGTNLDALLPGRFTNLHLVVSAHYDTYQTSTFGAYDDASGVAAALELARVLRTREWNYTLEFILFDREDQGLSGSKSYVRGWLEGTDTYEIAGMVYFSMVGISYPCATPTDGVTPLRALMKEHPSEEGYERLFRSAVAVPRAFPEGSVRAQNDSGQGSTYSEFSFDQVNVPNLLVMGQFERQVVVANVPFGSYPFAHNLDTQAAMEAWCGGADKLVAAYQLSLDYVARFLEDFDGPPYPLLARG